MVKELAELLGKEVVVRVGGLFVFCTVKDAREVYGKTQVLVVPVWGAGEVWKDLGPGCFLRKKTGEGL